MNKVKFVKLTVLVCALALLLGGCENKHTASSENAAFFAWTEGYAALAEGETSDLALTSFYPEGAQDTALEGLDSETLVFADGEAPVELVFTDGESPATVTGIHLSESAAAQQEGMQFRGLILTVSAVRQGVAACEELILRQQDGSEVRRKFGRVVFDVGPAEPVSPAFDTYSGAALATSPESFAYSWGKTDAQAAITAIQYGADQTITSPGQLLDSIAEEKGLPVSGSIALDAYQAPLVYIKAKITVQTPAGTQTEYAKGCYCGTDFDAADIEASRERNLKSRDA